MPSTAYCEKAHYMKCYIYCEKCANYEVLCECKVIIWLFYAVHVIEYAACHISL